MLWSREHKEQFESFKGQIQQQKATNDTLTSEIAILKDKLGRCIATINGMNKGTLNEQFLSFKQEAHTAMAVEVGKVVEEKLIGIMSMFISNKEEKTEPKEKEIKEVKEKPSQQPIAPPLHDLLPLLKNLEKDIKEIKTQKVKEYEVIANKYEAIAKRMTKLEVDQASMNRLLEKFMTFFKKYEEGTPDLKVD